MVDNSSVFTHMFNENRHMTILTDDPLIRTYLVIGQQLPVFLYLYLPVCISVFLFFFPLVLCLCLSFFVCLYASISLFVCLHISLSVLLLSHSFTGAFGGVRGKHYLAVQSLDGCLVVYEQESLAFTTFLPGCLLPGPLAYLPKADALVTVAADWSLQCYRCVWRGVKCNDFNCKISSALHYHTLLSLSSSLIHTLSIYILFCPCLCFCLYLSFCLSICHFHTSIC